MKVYTHIPNGTDYIEGIASPRDYFIEQTREINCVMSCAKQENDANLFASSRRQLVSTYNNNYNIFVHQFLQIIFFMKQRYIHTATIYGEFHTVSSLFKKACRRWVTIQAFINLYQLTVWIVQRSTLANCGKENANATFKDLCLHSWIIACSPKTERLSSAFTQTTCK